MKRFHFGDDESEYEEDEDDLEDMRFMMPDSSELIAMTQMEDPNHYLLNYALKICEKSIFWRFTGVSSRLKMIDTVFHSIKKLTEEQDDAEV